MISHRRCVPVCVHYHGSAKCFLLMGDAVGRSLANLMAGGEPLINAELKTTE
jgi:hypothetical protein